MSKLHEEEFKALREAATVLRSLSRYHNDAFQRERDSTSALGQHKSRVSMEKAVQLDRMANEIDTVASSDGL